MKRLIPFIILLLLPLGARAEKTVSKAKLDSFFEDARRFEGVEFVKLGRVATAALKSTIRLSVACDGDADEDTRHFFSLMRGVTKIAILDYDDCSAEDKNFLTGRLSGLFEGSELLVEMRDEGETMQIYGVVDESGDTVRDFVLYNPSGCALICIFGKMSMKALSQMMEDND